MSYEKEKTTGTMYAVVRDYLIKPVARRMFGEYEKFEQDKEMVDIRLSRLERFCNGEELEVDNDQRKGPRID